VNSNLHEAQPGATDLSSVPHGTSLVSLENGLTIIIREDRSAPVVSAQAWCMSGSIHEGKWLGAGLSHVLEHMLFKGTTTRPGSRIDQEVQEAGGSMNAYTSFDRTVYHIDVPSTGAGVALDILTDIMQNATLPDDELEKEKQVILREMDINVDDPQRRAGRRLFETAYTRSPYRYTIIGYRDVFDLLTPADIKAYYREKYTPNNVFYVVVGDISTGDVVSRIKAAYAGARSKPLPALTLPAEPPQTGCREVIEEAPIELGYTHMAWHIPDIRHPDIPALEILAIVLGNGRSSRLYREVREKAGVAHSAYAWTYLPGNEGLFGVSCTLDADRYSAAREAVLREIQRIREQPVDAAEISKAVKQFLSATLSSRKTMQGQAGDLGSSWIAANDLNFSERTLAAVRRVTAEDVQRVARTYLQPDKSTTYALLPEGTAPQNTPSHVETSGGAIQKHELSNGLRVLLKEDRRLPFVEFRTIFSGGVLAETSENNGITQLMGKLLLKGTATRSSEDIAREMEEIGGSIDSYGGNNTFGLNAEVLNVDFATGLDLVSDVLLRPAFPDAALERERSVQLAGIRAQNDHLLQSAFRAMRRTLFNGTGYGLDAIGSEEAVLRLSREQVAAMHRSCAIPSNCVLAIFGDIDPAKTLEAVRQAFGGWQGAQKPPLNLGFRPRESVHRAVQVRDKKQAVVVMGFGGTTIRDPRRYALDLLQEACSDLGSRLFLRVREELSLAYFVGAQHFSGVAPGYFAFYAGTLPEKAAVVEEEFKKEALLLQTEGLSEEELNRAKAKVVGHRKIARQDLGHIAMNAALDELHGLGFDHSESEDARYEEVTLEQVREAARQFLRPDAHVVAVAGPESP
jgi:zinc protease